MKRRLYGVATNDADYPTVKKITTGYKNGKQIQKTIWICPFYSAWSGMIRRCYSKKLKEKYPTYKESRVCEEWLLFSSFRSWMILQDWSGNQLDKDLKVKGNKIYSPETCLFVSRQVNMFLTENQKKKNNHPLGVGVCSKTAKFTARCKNLGSGSVYLGLFESADSAKKAYWEFKCKIAKVLALRQTNAEVSKYLLIRYSLED